MSRLRAALLGLIGLVFLAGCGAPPAASWPGLAANADLAFVAYNNRVVAVNLADGKQAWSFPASPGGSSDQFFADPGVSPDMIVVGSEGPTSSYSGALFGLDPASGEQQWCLAFDEKAAQRLNCPLTPTATRSVFFGLMPPVDNRIVGGITVADGIAYFGMANNNVYAVDALTGEYLWEAAARHPIWAAPAVDAETVYVVSLDHALYALERATGRIEWTQELGGMLVGTPALVDDTLLVGTFGKRLVALDAARQGAERWSVPADNAVWSGPTVRDGVAYFTDLSGGLYAVDLAAGTLNWRQTPGGVLRGSPAVAGELVFIGDKDGNLYARSAATGADQWTQKVAGDNPGQMLASPLAVPERELVLVAPYQGSNWLVAYTTGGALKWAFAPSQ